MDLAFSFFFINHLLTKPSFLLWGVSSLPKEAVQRAGTASHRIWGGGQISWSGHRCLPPSCTRSWQLPGESSCFSQDYWWSLLLRNCAADPAPEQSETVSLIQCKAMGHPLWGRGVLPSSSPDQAIMDGPGQRERHSQCTQKWNSACFAFRNDFVECVNIIQQKGRVPLGTGELGCQLGWLSWWVQQHHV